MTQPDLFTESPDPRPVPKRGHELTPAAVENIRRATNKERVLQRLRQGPATTMDLIAVGGARAIGRCWELRKQGHVIRIDELKPGLFRYTLVQEAA